MAEYAEFFDKKLENETAIYTLRTLMELKNVTFTNIHYNFQLIQNDLDYNKFVDCAIAGNVDYLISNDKHFNVLKTIDFPKLNLLKLEEFELILKGKLTKRIIRKENYNIEIDTDGLNINYFDNQFNGSYEIPVKWLLTTREERFSDILLQLSGKPWISERVDLLYDIAEITHESFPLKQIDWLKTLSQIAWEKYLTSLHRKEQGKFNKKKTSAFDSLFSIIKLNIEEQNKTELKKNLVEGVSEELKKRKII